MTTVYDLSNSSAWNLIYEGDKTAPPVPAKQLQSTYPIPEFELSIQPSSPILIVYAQSISAKSNWRTAGFIKQKIRAGILSGGGTDTYASLQRFFLKEFNLVQFPKLSSTYVVKFSIPYWIRDITLRVWEYTGLIDDVVEQQIQNLEQKLVECCDELKQAVSNQADTSQIITKLNQIQAKLEECCNGDIQAKKAEETITIFTGFL